METFLTVSVFAIAWAGTVYLAWEIRGNLEFRKEMAGYRKRQDSLLAPH